DTFLAAPGQMVPGTSMTVGVPNAAQRAAIIGYLEGAVAQ
ncbi:MAG: cytochrome c family protein, partial [Mesorhizobium sp.]